jgi:mRNA-degrading endonuclease toxin of MazEF toxin-antitoxin module
MTKRGDIVIVDFPFVGGSQGKTRPAVVVQCDQLNQRIDNTPDAKAQRVPEGHA